ncbi:TonB-dependent receptor [Brasilonema sp. UFV-L1]|uniref:TonB-dependent receptor n=1 Tax=Brasilonema sp. UFV-L1 TaxID=2234130 RepID=UPI00145DA308|nr:TonB-dependent receptor [Brasilonema sp. UFV-L1]NMG06754.1 TonB-dependent siderophore receptor [Brasilonema sp. UFV-L1]
MEFKQLVPSLLLTSAIVVLVTTPTKSEEVSSIRVHKSPASTDSGSSTQQARLVTKAQHVKPITEIRRLSEIEHPSKNAQMLLVQSPAQETAPSSEVVQVTGVKANPTKTGVEVILQTSKGQALQLVNRSTGNSFITDIPNAQLRLPSGDAFTFRSDKPIAGVTQITVTNFDAKTIRVTVIGEMSVPQVELFDSPNEGLIFSVASTAPSAQQGQQPQTQQPQAQQPETQTQPTQPSASGDEPIELVVTGQQDGYNPSVSTTGTKTDTPQRDIPQSIQVVPQQVLEDQQVRNLGEALRNVPGLARGANSASRGQFATPKIRGFDANDNIFRDGLRDPTTGYVVPDVAGIERIEVLKGPGSVLYGQGSLGGVINLVTKKPLSDPYYSVEASVGSFNFYRGAFDFSGPLNDSKTLLYRLNFAAQTTESFLDFYDEQKYFVAPVLSWQISDRTQLTFQAEYVNRPKDYGQQGIPAVGSVLPNRNGKVPRDRNTAEPDSTDDQRSFRVGYDLEHRFSDHWQFRNAFSASWLRRDRNYVFSTALAAADNLTLSRIYQLGGDDQRFFNLDTYIVGKFATGSIQHQLVTGFNLTRSESDLKITTGRAASLDVFNPVYGKQLGAVTSRGDNTSSTDTLGIYVQDQVTLASNLKLLLGLRFDTLNQTNEDRLNNTKQAQSDDAFSPRVGLVYQPIEPISLYANYSRSFTPNTGTAFNGSSFQPERGTSYEVGIKGDISNTLSATLAFYDLTRSNVLTEDPVNEGFSIQTGEQRSKGVELSIAGEILPGWNVIAGYAYTDTEITKDNTYAVGNLLNNVPKHSFNLWTSYEIQSGRFKGLGFGTGVFYVGERQGDLNNTFTLPSYFLTEVAIFYKQDRFRASVNFKNLFDVDYFESALNQVNVYYGDPFTVQGTISWQF